jgi:DNA adenine methylase
MDIHAIRERLRFVHGDGLAAMRASMLNVDAVFFIDPPYTASTKKAGTRLYTYHQINHELLFDLAGQIKGNFLITYDDADEVRALALAHRFETRLVSMSNTHHATMNELLIGRDLSWVR